jgi:CheY-like chemotaxis protein
MKVEVRCPDCDRPWYVDQSTTGEMLCPGCMTRIPLEGLATAPPVDEPASATDMPAADSVHVDSPPVAEVEPTQPVSDSPVTEITSADMRPAPTPIDRADAPAREVADVASPSEAIPDTSRPAVRAAEDEPKDFEDQPVPVEAAAAKGRVTGSALEAATDAAAAHASKSMRTRTSEPVVCPRCNLHFEPRRQPSKGSVERKTVLVVDDLAYFRQIAKDALEPTFDVKTAATSAEARDLITAGEFDLLVLDLTLDGCNAGRELLAELRPKPCPILIFTAQDESEMYGENWENLKRLGADDLVIKGMRVAESLTRKASSLLGVPVDDADPIG